MHRGRFVQHHRSPLENPAVTLTQEGGLFLPEKKDTSGLKEVQVLFPLISRTAWVLQRQGNVVFFLLPVPAVKFISSGTFTKS